MPPQFGVQLPIFFANKSSKFSQLTVLGESPGNEFIEFIFLREELNYQVPDVHGHLSHLVIVLSFI